jgi:hypothetical protein
LTGIELLEPGPKGIRLTKAAKDRYVLEVLGLLATGNADGKGGLPTTQIFSSLIPLPPFPGPVIMNVTTLEPEPLFWFKPDPIAALMASQLQNKDNNPFWHAIFPDLLYEKTAIALDANGSTPLFPIFDVSAAFPDIKIFPITLPELAIEASLMPLPKLMLKLLDLSIALGIPIPPIPPIPPFLSFPDFSIPDVPFPGLPSLVLPDLLLGMIKLPFDLIIKLVAPPDLGLVLDLPNLPGLVLKLAMDIVLKLLIDLGLLLIVPKLFVASLLIYIKNVVAIVCTDIVGMLVGAGGVLTKTMATITGLI